jgi:hypothetical protein
MAAALQRYHGTSSYETVFFSRSTNAACSVIIFTNGPILLSKENRI